MTVTNRVAANPFMPITEEAEKSMDIPREPFDSPANHPHGPSTAPVPPAPAGYFSAPDPTPGLVPEPGFVPEATAERGAGPETSAGHPAASVAKAVRHPVRVGTIVWGAVVLVLGILLILRSQLDLNLNAGLTAMWLLLGAGMAMVAGGAVNLFRKARA